MSQRMSVAGRTLGMFVVLVACREGPGDAVDADAAVTAPVDPFTPQAEPTSGLTDVSADLTKVLEGGALAMACETYAAAPGDREAMMRCGKAMFFYEGFSTSGVPAALVDWLLESFPGETGPGFANLGMIPDPFSSSGYPLGLAPGAPLGEAPTLAFTCASCHFARMPDGRYAVGAPNHDLAYGRLNLMLALTPMMAVPGADDSAHDPEALAVIQPLRDRMAADATIQLSFFTAAWPLLTSGTALPTFSATSERWYARWRSGTMDFFIEPLPFDDQVHTVSKISALWGIPSASELAGGNIDSAMLGWTGGTSSLENFVHSFVDLGGGDVSQWPSGRLAPLAEYVRSLRAPPPLVNASADQLARGRDVYVAACQECHDGPRGMGRRIYGFDEIGSDDAIQWWADGPDHDGEPCCGLRFPAGDTITHGIKSPRLVGLSHMRRFLHNGSLDSLEQLLCLAARPGTVELAFASVGHEMGCELTAVDRQLLIQYLRAH